MSQELHPATAAYMAGKLGFSFSGAGFLFGYPCGVAQQLEHIGLLNASSMVSGSSAGALIAVGLKCGISAERLLQSHIHISRTLHAIGVKKNLKRVLEQELRQLLPSDAHERCNAGGIYLESTRVHGPCPVCWNTRLLSTFQSRDDLIAAILAATYIPRLSDGHLMMKFRGRRYMDGGIRRLFPAVPGAEYTVRVYCLPAQYIRRFHPYHTVIKSPAPEAIDVACDMYGPWPHTWKECNKQSLTPQSDDFIQFLARRGRADAERWANEVGLTAVRIGKPPPQLQQQQQQQSLLSVPAVASAQDPGRAEYGHGSSSGSGSGLGGGDGRARIGGWKPQHAQQDKQDREQEDDELDTHHVSDKDTDSDSDSDPAASQQRH